MAGRRRRGLVAAGLVLAVAVALVAEPGHRAAAKVIPGKNFGAYTRSGFLPPTQVAAVSHRRSGAPRPARGHVTTVDVRALSPPPGPLEPFGLWVEDAGAVAPAGGDGFWEVDAVRWLQPGENYTLSLVGLRVPRGEAAECAGRRAGLPVRAVVKAIVMMSEPTPFPLSRAAESAPTVLDLEAGPSPVEQQQPPPLLPAEPNVTAPPPPQCQCNSTLWTGVCGPDYTPHGNCGAFCNGAVICDVGCWDLAATLGDATFVPDGNWQAPQLDFTVPADVPAQFLKIRIYLYAGLEEGEPPALGGGATCRAVEFSHASVCRSDDAKCLRREVKQQVRDPHCSNCCCHHYPYDRDGCLALPLNCAFIRGECRATRRTRTCRSQAQRCGRLGERACANDPTCKLNKRGECKAKRNPPLPPPMPLPMPIRPFPLPSPG